MRAWVGPHSYARHSHLRSLASGRTICALQCTSRHRTDACHPRSAVACTVIHRAHPRIGWSRRTPSNRENFEIFQKNCLYLVENDLIFKNFAIQGCVFGSESPRPKYSGVWIWVWATASDLGLVQMSDQNPRKFHLGGEELGIGGEDIQEPSCKAQNGF